MILKTSNVVSERDGSGSMDRLVASRRILVLGPSGAGKTWLSLRLARLLDIEPIHLDAKFWKPGWTPTPQSEWRETVATLLQRPAWIIDGFYESTLDLRIPAAESIIVVERSRLACLCGILWRKISGEDAARPDAPPGQKIDGAFIRYIWRYPNHIRPLMSKLLNQRGGGKNIIYVHSRDEVTRLLRAVAEKTKVPFEPASILRRYVRWLLPYRGVIVGLLLLSLLVTVLEMIWPLAFRQIVLIVTGNLGESKTSKIQRLHLIGGTVLLLLLVKQVLASWRQLAISAVSAKLILRLRQTVFERLMHLPLRDLNRVKSGALVQRLFGNVENTGQLMQYAFVDPAILVMHIGVSLAVVLWLNWKLALAAIVAGLPLTLVSWLRRRRVRPVYRESNRLLNSAAGHAQETLSGIRVVRAFRRELRERRRFSIELHKVLRKVLTAERAETMLDGAWGLMIPGVGLILVWYGGYLVLTGAMTLADILAFQIYGVLLLQPFQQLISSINGAQRGFAAAEHVFEILDMRPEDPDPPNASDAPREIRSIQFEKMSFEYTPGHLVLREIDFIVAGGSTIALVGPSGAGKTTLTDLLARFHSPTSGTIRINGSDIAGMRLRSYRSLLAIVQQETFLFDGTVRDNIAYGLHGATEEQIVDSARRANAHDFISAMPGGYDALIGERGVRLSGGQRQRLAIARALLANPKILILDEATSHLDAESEHLIQESLVELLKGRTTFIIAHRLSTIRSVQTVVVLDQGQVKEMGTHDELMNRGGLYCEMVQRQQLSTPAALQASPVMLS